MNKLLSKTPEVLIAVQVVFAGVALGVGLNLEHIGLIAAGVALMAWAIIGCCLREQKDRKKNGKQTL